MDQPPVLDYRSAGSPRAKAVGGLRLLGILTVLPAALILLETLTVGVLWNEATFVIFGVSLSAGLCKLVLSSLVARNNGPAAYAAISIVALEMLGLLVMLATVLIQYGFERPIVPVLLGIGPIGWGAVEYEIAQTLRRCGS